MALHTVSNPPALRQNLFFPKSRIPRPPVLSTSERISGIQNGPRKYQSYQKIAKKAWVTQNAKVFESGNNFHLQPTAIWNKANTKLKQKNRIIFQKLGILQIRLKLLRLNCVWWWSNVNLFRLYQRKTFSQIERCEVVWSPNLVLLIAFIFPMMNLARIWYISKRMGDVKAVRGVKVWG